MRVGRPIALRLLSGVFAAEGSPCMLLYVLLCRRSSANDGCWQLQGPDAVVALFGESVCWALNIAQGVVGRVSFYRDSSAWARTDC